MATNTVVLRPTRIVGVLALVTVLLIVASVVGQLAAHAFDHRAFEVLSKLLNLNEERNIPTAFSSLLLFLSALLLAVIALLKYQRREPFVLQWAVLALGFTAMAIDESMSFHERLTGPMRSVLGNEDLGLLYFAWVVPALLLVLVLGLFFLKFLWKLPRRTAGLFVLAAALFLGGALGVEVLGGRHAEQYGMDTFGFAALSTVEESLEMIGVLVFLWALLTYLAEHHGEVELIILQPSASAARAPHSERGFKGATPAGPPLAAREMRSGWTAPDR